MLDLENCIGLGVAGNFANHLEQAGEASDFINVEVEEENAPKGIFPFYLKDSNTFLATFPISNDKIIPPKNDANLHMEPELALLCEISYNDTNISNITPIKFAAFNDCTIRKDGASKISEKKNWGKASKGISSTFINIDKFDNGGVLDNYRIASFLRRGEQFEVYGVDSPVLGYNYFYSKLKNWIINKLNTQKDENPLEDINSYLNTLKKPKYALLSVGATSYTKFGESGFLKSGDKVYIFIYDATKYEKQEILEFARNDDIQSKEAISLLCQNVI